MSTRLTYKQIVSNSLFRTKRLGYILLEPAFLVGRFLGAVSLWIGHSLVEIGDTLKSDSTSRLSKSFATEQEGSQLTWRPFAVSISIISLLLTIMYVSIDDFPFIDRLDNTPVPQIFPIDSTVVIDTAIIATVDTKRKAPVAESKPQQKKVDKPAVKKSDSKVDESNMLPYIKRYYRVARDEHAIFGIPASIKMGQAIIESGYGKGTLTKYNNHFSIKCFETNCAKGHCVNHEDDSSKDFFRVYETVWLGWRAHSHFLKRDRYSKCFDCGDDYRCWAKELAAAGYATDPKYASKLIRVIEENKLYKLDE